MHVNLGGYHVGDVEFVAAFDVDAAKVGLDLGKAIFAGQNNTIRFAPVADLGVSVQRGPTLDGLGKYYRQTIEESPLEPVDVAAVLRRTGADVLVAYLPVGSRGGPEALRPGLPRRQGGASSTPSRCSSPAIRCGPRSSPTPVFRSSATTSRARSAPPSCTASWPDCSRTAAWSWTAPTSSTSAATWTSRTCSSGSGWSPRRSPRPRRSPARLDNGIEADDVHIGPSDHVAWLDDRKWAYIRLEGRNFGDVPLNVELKLEVWDSPNSAGVIIDALRCAKLAKDRGIGGPLLGPSRLLHEVAARAVPRRRGPPHGGGVRRGLTGRRAASHARRIPVRPG